MPFKAYLVLAESAIERVPEEILEHPSVAASAHRFRLEPHEVILDASLHHSAMLRLADYQKRGRPDIVHACLHLLTDSPLFRNRSLCVFVHTRDNHVIALDPSIRFPPNYNRFIGLLHQLYKFGKVPPSADHPLMTLQPMSLEQLIAQLHPTIVVLLSEKGEARPLSLIAKYALQHPPPTYVVGGFQALDFDPTTYELADEVVRVYPHPAKAATIVARLLTLLEISAGIIS
ncbi:16S rRNA methyltransferase [archaeon]|nr:16S rRNA methyltransferase [archaeon]